MTESMFLYGAALLAGLIMLVWSADRFVFGASAVAVNLGISPLLIGLTVVGFGTSAPEILVAVMSSMNGNPGIAVGNSIGSNIANVGLVLGATAIVAPMVVSSKILKRELPIMMLLMLGIYLMLFWDESLDVMDGVILSAGTLFLVLWIVMEGLNGRKEDVLESEFEAEIQTGVNTGKAVFWLITGMIILILSSRLMVWGATEIAVAIGVSDLVIGLTIIAIGTSLPELAASITSALKGEPDIAIGNVIGSNMFNLLPVLAIPALISPHTLSSDVIHRDFPIMIMMGLALFVFAWGFRGKGRITRIEGMLLLISYFSYMFYLYLRTSGAL